MSKNSKKKEVALRSSAAEYLTFVASTGESDESFEVRYEDENIWLTQKMMAALYDVSKQAISQHIQRIYEDGELTPEATVKKYLTVQTEGDRRISRELDHYSLGWTMDKERLKKGHMFTDEYFERQLQNIREIRLSERKFYQKVTDLYATAFDYDKDSKTTRLFFQTVQNKLHYAVHRHTAAELIVERADATKEHMGLTTWENAPDGKIVKADVIVAKNYLSEEEMSFLERLVTLYLDYAELQAERKIPMSMEDWAKRLDGFLEFNGNELLTGPGKISAEQAKLHAETEFEKKLHAETEFEKYRIIQDRLYESDFDRFLMLEQNSGDD